MAPRGRRDQGQGVKRRSTTQGAERYEEYLAEFERVSRENGGGAGAPLAELRQRAIARFGELGFPTKKLEEWRFTSVLPITETTFELAKSGLSDVSRAQLSRFTFDTTPFNQLVFINGQYAPQFSLLESLPSGVNAGGLGEAVDQNPELVDQYLTRLEPYQNEAFTALNTAFLFDGAFLRIPANVIVEQPIHLLFVTTAHEAGTVHYPRVLILAGENSQACVLESYVGLHETQYFTNAVTEIIVGPNAAIDHYKLLQESLKAFHVARMHVSLDRASSFSSHAITLGGALVRNDVYALLDGEGVDCTLNGFYLANGRRLIDNHTTINHAKPNCSSHELYKGILDDEGHGVFNGKIVVQLNAQKTDAKQTNQSLLLSETALINTKPQLEILADDVKCTHGATVGQLDKDAMFYLRTRGLSYTQARSMLIHAFASDILHRIKLKPVQAQLEHVLLGQLLLPAQDEPAVVDMDNG